jgi:hypothetical protein
VGCVGLCGECVLCVPCGEDRRGDGAHVSRIVSTGNSRSQSTISSCGSSALVYISASSMTQPDVALTDYGLALICLFFGLLLWAKQKSSWSLRSWFVFFFFSIALAAALGGTVHGFYEEDASIGHRILWRLSMVAIGATAWFGTGTAAIIHFGPATARALTRLAAAVFVLYCFVVLFIKNDFVVAIIDYLPVVLFLGWAFLAAYQRTKRPAFLAGFTGICVMLIAAGVQQAKLGLHPHYFNHNAVYHVLQAIGLFLVFLTGRDASNNSEVCEK